MKHLLITLVFAMLLLMNTKSTFASWSADNKNYFNEWQCSSTSGIDRISKLDILPFGAHNSLVWKDSLYVSLREYVNGNPIINYTLGDFSANSLFSLNRTEYDSSNNVWEIYDQLSNPSNRGGISSFDGVQSDYIMNEYYIPGWGPTANKKGSESKIPGVSETNVYSNNIGFPLWGTGPLGLSTIREKIQNPNYDRNVNTCLQMNPTLFDFDVNDIPHSFMAQLFTNTPSTGCSLPDKTMLKPGYYVYRYINSTLGWQLDLTTGLVFDSGGLDYAFNYIWGSKSKFLKSIWNGKIEDVNLEQSPPRIAKTILDCSKADVTFSEPSGREDLVYFLADPPPHYSTVGTNNVYIHDIYVAYKGSAFSESTPSPNTAPSSPACPNGDKGNLNCDSSGLINTIDLSILLSQWGKQNCSASADINKDCSVNATDLSILLSNWKVN